MRNMRSFAMRDVYPGILRRRPRLIFESNEGKWESSKGKYPASIVNRITPADQTSAAGP